MRMIRRMLIVLAALNLLVFAEPAAASTQDFTITSFTADYYLDRDEQRVSTMRVHEEIVAQFPNFDQNHGILRALPQSYDGHSLELQVQTVQKPDGSDWPYSTYTENDNLVLKIGAADAYVYGEQRFVIEYTVRGPVQQQPHRLFWDANGDQWPQTFGAVIARIHVPAHLTRALQGGPSCFTGSFSSEVRNCTATITPEAEGRLVTVATTKQLQGSQTLTFAMSFAENTFAPYAISVAALWQLAGWAILLTTPTIIALWVMLRAWRKHGRDAKGKGVHVPQYIPPKGVSVLGASTVLHQGFQPKAVSATIIDVAVRHYIKIFETGKKMFGKYTYDIELVKAPTNLRAEEKEVVKLLFGANAAPGTRVSLESLSKKLYTKAQAIGTQVDVLMTAEGYFVQNPAKARLPFIIAGVVLAVLGFVVPPYTLGLIPAALVCFIGVAIMAAPTKKGAELKEYVLGLKMYMQLAEAERLKVLQSPHGALTEKVDITNKGQLVRLYERLLPYAVLFGIEKDWAKQFAHLYEQQPDWYSGTGAFHAVYFASAIHSLDTAMTQSFTPPSSSGSGAGGGGGGGGGGGW